MRQKSFFVDPNLCLGCRSCQTACSVNRGLAPGVYWRRVTLVEYVDNGQIVKYYLSTSCHQCMNPECIRLCPQKAYRKRHDGIVILDLKKCKSCSTCTHGCPFEAPVRNQITGQASKCDYCYEKLDKGQNPYCIDACPVKAIQLREFSLTEDEEDDFIVKVLPGIPKIQLTCPSVRYRSLTMGKQVTRFKV